MPSQQQKRSIEEMSSLEPHDPNGDADVAENSLQSSQKYQKRSSAVTESSQQHVPDDMLHCIFAFLRGYEIAGTCALVCRDWHRLCAPENGFLWQRVVSGELGFVPSSFPFSVASCSGKKEIITVNDCFELYKHKYQGSVPAMVRASRNFISQWLAQFRVESDPTKDLLQKILNGVLNGSEQDVDSLGVSMQDFSIGVGLVHVSPENTGFEDDDDDDDNGDDDEVPKTAESLDDMFAIGESKFGGWPDLPCDMGWPAAAAFEGGEENQDEADDEDTQASQVTLNGQRADRMAFIMQLNLSEMSLYDSFGHLPQCSGGGMLYFWAPNVHHFELAKSSIERPFIMLVTKAQIERQGGLERRRQKLKVGRVFNYERDEKVDTIPYVCHPKKLACCVVNNQKIKGQDGQTVLASMNLYMKQHKMERDFELFMGKTGENDEVDLTNERILEEALQPLQFWNVKDKLSVLEKRVLRTLASVPCSSARLQAQLPLVFAWRHVTSTDDHCSIDQVVCDKLMMKSASISAERCFVSLPDVSENAEQILAGVVDQDLAVLSLDNYGSSFSVFFGANARREALKMVKGNPHGERRFAVLIRCGSGQASAMVPQRSTVLYTASQTDINSIQLDESQILRQYQHVLTFDGQSFGSDYRFEQIWSYCMDCTHDWANQHLMQPDADTKQPFHALHAVLRYDAD